MARFLADHPRIEKVYYPGLESHPYYEVARRTMRGFGGLVTFLVRDADWRETAAVVDAVRIPRIAPSLGGVESLIEQPLVMSYYKCTPEERRRYGIPDNMIRLSCGIENPEDLVADLAQALARTAPAASGHAGSKNQRWRPDTHGISHASHPRRQRARTGHRRDRPADPSGHHLRAARRRATGGSTTTRAAAIRRGERSRSRWPISSRAAARWRSPRAWPPSTPSPCCLAQGDHMLAGSDVYGGTYRLLHKVINHSGIDVTLADVDRSGRARAGRHAADQIAVDRKPRQSAAVDYRHRRLRRVGTRAHGMLLAVDSTFATPVLTRPLELGADIVMHSATKYIGGHSDVLGGALVVADPELFERLYFIQNATGAVMGPLEAYLCSRGLKTLELRVREQCRTAQRLAEYLAQRTRGSPAFFIPGLADHPGHELARRQMDGGFGAMVSFEIAGDYQSGQADGRIDPPVQAGGQPGSGRIADRAAGRDVARQLRPQPAAGPRPVRRPGPLVGRAGSV